MEVVQIHGLLDFSVLSTDIHDKLVVDEHPDVIVAVEFKVLSLDIDEFCLDLHGEPVVVFSRNVVTTGDRVVMRILDRLGFIEPAEVI